jgi:hypothetical protein
MFTHTYTRTHAGTESRVLHGSQSLLPVPAKSEGVEAEEKEEERLYLEAETASVERGR